MAMFPVEVDIDAVPAKKPNEPTREAIRELEEGGGKEFQSIRALFEDLGIEAVLGYGSQR